MIASLSEHDACIIVTVTRMDVTATNKVIHLEYGFLYSLSVLHFYSPYALLLVLFLHCGRQEQEVAKNSKEKSLKCTKFRDLGNGLVDVHLKEFMRDNPEPLLFTARYSTDKFD